MHKEHQEHAVAAAAINGEKVAIFHNSWGEVQQLLEPLESVAVAWGMTPSRKSRRNGDMFLDFYGGGSICFLSLRSEAQRGRSLDRAYVPIGTSMDALLQLTPCLGTSTIGVLTGY